LLSHHEGVMWNSSAIAGTDESAGPYRATTWASTADLFATKADLVSGTTSGEEGMSSKKDDQISDLFTMSYSVPVFEATDFGKSSRESSFEVPPSGLSCQEEKATEVAEVFARERLSGDSLNLADGDERFPKGN